MTTESADRSAKSARTAREAEEKDSGSSGSGSEGGGFFPDLVRKGLTLGFTGMFMTEEAIRRALGESVPRDVLEYLLEQTERTRSEFLDRLSKEFGRALSALDPVEVAKRLLEGRSVEITAEIRLVPGSKKKKPARREGGD